MFYKVFDNKVYKCNLASIDESSIIYKDLSTKENIKNAKKEIIKEIMIQKTLSKKYVKELVTGKVFPIYRYTNDFSIDHFKYYIDVPSYMVFAYIEQSNYYGNIREYLYEANDLEVIDYLENHSDKKAYAKELDELCKEKEQLYSKLKSLNIVSTKGKVKQKIKD